MQRWRVDRFVPGKRKRFISEDAIPWQVGLRRPDSVVKCGGVLLSEKVIISAAHCKNVLKFDGLDEAVIGSILTYQTIGTEEPYWLSKKHFIHPRYQEFRTETLAMAIYDLMLLFLSKSNLFCPGARSFARLPDSSFNENFLSGKDLLLSGWGRTSPISRQEVLASFKGKPLPGKQPGHVRHVKLSYLPSNICQKRLQKFFNEYPNVEGKPMKADLPRDIRYVTDINLEIGSGLSMMCTSTCVAEDINNCPRCNDPKGCPHEQKDSCVGDSGGTI